MYVYWIVQEIADYIDVWIQCLQLHHSWFNHIVFFLNQENSLESPPLLYFIKTQKTNTEQDKRKTLLVIQSEARTRRKTKNHLTQESTQERKTDRLFSKILYACSRASSSRDLLVSQADSYMTQAYMDMRKFTK